VNQQFREVVGKWAHASVPDQLLGVARIAIQDTAEIVVDETPVDTGFLVANWQPSLNAPDLSLVLGANGYDASAAALTVTDLKLGDVFYFTNNAVYARRINYGFVGADSLGRHYNQVGRHMIETAVGYWPTTVERAAGQLAS
jgi:hypothetical protein